MIRDPELSIRRAIEDMPIEGQIDYLRRRILRTQGKRFVSMESFNKEVWLRSYQRILEELENENQPKRTQ